MIDPAAASDLSHWDKEFTTASSFRASVDDLPPGIYEFQIIDADLVPANNNHPICRLHLRLLPGSKVYERAYFDNQRSINLLGADLAAVGGNIDPARPFSAQVGKLLAEAVGACFRAVRSDRKDGKDTTKTWKDFSIIQPLPRQPVPVQAARTAAGIPATLAPARADIPW